MKIRKKKVIYAMAVIGCIVVFAFCVSGKLAGGARWSSGLPLGGVDNWLYEGGSLYTVAEEGITPGASYFPGLVLLSLLYRLIFGYGAETAIIITGGIIAIFTFWGFSIVVSDDKKQRFWIAIGAALFFVIEFPEARFYLLEMHPDIPALMFFLWGVIFLNRFLERYNKFYYCAATILFWFAGLFKQNAVFLYIGLAIYVLLSKKLGLREKVSIIISELIAGVATLVVVMLIDGCWYNCITVNSLHPLLSIKEYLYYGVAACWHNKIFIVFAFAYLILLIRGNIVQRREIEHMWFASSIGWLVFCIYGSAKEGANAGNMEAAIVTVMPFVLITVVKLFVHMKGMVNIDKMKDGLATLKAKKFFHMAVVAISSAMYIAVVLAFIYQTDIRMNQFSERIKLQNEFSEWLSAHYGGKKVAYNTITYELFHNASVDKAADLYTATVWEMGGLINDEKLHEMSTGEKWDVIVTWSGFDDTKWPKTFREFQKTDSGLYPDLSRFYGSQVEVYVRNE